MEKLTGHKKIKTAVFISGRGSNLNNLIKFSNTKKSPIVIELVIADKKAIGLKYAVQYKIKKKIINYKNNRIAEKKILLILEKKKIKFICLAGFMKVLSANFIKRFKEKIINIHPSYLPKYKGLNTSLRALNNNEKFSGCTVHYVGEKIDSGKIIIQKKVKITKKETETSLDKKIIQEEHKLYPAAIMKIFN
jgi:phosphoribosylglycinamide formyltransferase-1|tara:strand:- start:14 stop:589 length:576 start_codon:yes stop_codon:yes gene_type:complete